MDGCSLPLSEPELTMGRGMGGKVPEADRLGAPSPFPEPQ